MAEIDDIRKRLEESEATLERSFSLIRLGKTRQIDLSGIQAIVAIHVELRKALRLGHGNTLLIGNMCQKYGVEATNLDVSFE